MTPAPRHWDEEADVIVVGYGFAGATTAITAHDAGAKVLLLEKAPEEHKGGNSRVSANIVFWPDDVEQAKTYFRAMAGPYMDNIPDEMLDVWAKEMFANKAWLEGLGMVSVEIPYVEFPDLPGSECVHVLLNGDGPIGGERLWRLIEASVDARRIETRYQMPVVSLVKEQREIIGVIAQRQGKPVSIRADRGVVLTCGGFENNPTMIRNYVGDLPHVFPVGTPYNTGDGVRMGLEIGADLWHMNNVSGPILSFKASEIPVAQWLNLPHGRSYIFVGADGTRFTVEGEPCSVGDAHGKVKRHGQWGQQALPLPIFMIFDETYRKAGHIGKAGADWDVSHGNRYDWSDDNLREVAKGWIKAADTLAGLAEQIHIPAQTLEHTIARFNASAK